MRRCRSFPLIVAPLVVAAFVAGCDGKPLDYLEVKRIHEPIHESEAKAFLQIVESLPDGKLPPMERVFLNPPDWNESRTLPVNDLVIEEQNRLNDCWDVSRLAREWTNNRALQRALRRERITLEQFAGLTLTFGAALSRSKVRDDQDLSRLRDNGTSEIALLREDSRSFASLSEDARHYVLQRAIWITRRDRADRLLRVPVENVDRVERLGEILCNVFPSEFSVNAFDGIIDRLEEQGIPFEELPASGRDDEIEWRAEDALIGKDVSGHLQRGGD